jgi:cytosine/adenosine deaminase-related metal-dependent hydrolase
MSVLLLAGLGAAFATGGDTADCTHIQGEGISLFIRGNVITSPGIVPDKDCREITLPEGAVLAPAFIHPHTSVGLTEVSLEGRTNDAGSGLPGDVHAAFSPVDAYNPLSSLIPITRLEGIGTVIVSPGGGLIAGQSAAFDLHGSTQAQALAGRDMAMVASVGSGDGGSRADGLYRLRELLDDARVYRRQTRAFNSGKLRTLSASRLDLDALQPVLLGKLPLLIHADRASQIEALMRFAQEQDVKLILSGAAEGWMHAEALAEAGIPVLLDPMLYGVRSFSSIHARPDNAAILEKAGVKVMLVNLGFESHNARKLRQAAGNAVREGMTHAGAMDAITSNVAEAFGLPFHGRLDPGAQANVVAWSGDPLEISSFPLHMWIQGEEIDLKSRQSLLFEKYRTIEE